MHIGDTWEYNYAFTDTRALKRTIVSDTTIGIYKYFVAIENIFSFSDTVYYRVDAGGGLFSRRPGNRYETTMFQLNASANDKWETWYNENSHGYTMLTAENDILLNNTTTLSGCRHFSFDSSRGFYFQTETVLGRGPGIVRLHQYPTEHDWLITMELKHAVISGVSYNF
jgi:hypothetical protein